MGEEGHKTYIITSAQACYHTNKDGDFMPYGGGQGQALPHKKFIKGLESISEHLDAELMIMPIAGKRVTENVLHEDIRYHPGLFAGTKRLNQNLQIRDLVVPPQNVDPATGKARNVSKYNASIIFPHAKQRFAPVPVFQADLPRYLLTTGACTWPNYNCSNHRGDQARRDHVFGALVVEVIDDVFYNIRNLRAMKNGKFVDLGVGYDGGRKPSHVGVDSLVLGDIHWGDHDESTIAANYEMIEHFKPKRLILHDFFNGHSVNHHEMMQSMKRTREYGRGRLDLAEELKSDYEELVRMSKSVGRGGEVYVVASNHHAFLPRYINGEKWKGEDLWNAEMASYLFNQGASVDIPEEEFDETAFLLKQGIGRFGQIPSNVIFLRAQDDLRRWGYQLGCHGDKGKNGARGGGAKSREVTGGGKSVSGHSHWMEIYGDTYMVGTSSKLDLPYTFGGAGAQIAANFALYNDGTGQMLPIINGKWKMKR